VDGPTVATSAAEGRATAATDGRLAGALSDAASARGRLFEAEFKRAAWTAAYMGAMAVAAALLAVTAWLVFAGALVYAAASAGAPWWIGAVVVIAAHIVGSVWLLRRVHASVDRLTFAASRRALTSAFRFRSS
jgi:hypothetical protein